MPFVRAIRLSIRAKVLLLALGLALPPLITVSLLGLSSLNRAREDAEQISKAALQRQAETNLGKRATDKALLYNAALDDVSDKVEEVAAYATTLIAAGPAPRTNIGERVWLSPGGPTAEGERAHADAVARARQLIPLLRTAVQRRPLVSLAFIGLEDGGVSAFDKDIIDKLLQLESFDVRERPWYIAARDAGRTVWVDTYVDANTGKLVTTCATPLYGPDGKFVGVVGFDLLLDTIQQDLLQLDMGAAGYAFLINDSGKKLVAPELKVGELAWNQPFTGENLLETRDPKLHAVVQRMTQGQQGVERLYYQGGNVYLAFAPIKNAGWSVAMVIPETEINRPAEELGASLGAGQEQLRAQAIVLFGLSLVAVLALGTLLALVLTRPLLRLKAGAQRLAAGDLEHRLAQVSNDEIGDLVHSFNQMADALQEKVAELETNLRQLATLNEVSNNFKAILSLSQLLDSIPRVVCERFGFERAVLYLLEGDTLRAISASFGAGAADQAAEFIAIANSQPITMESETVEADILRSGQAVIVNNPWTHERVVQTKQAISRSESYVQAPIFGHQEKVIGLLSADYHYSRRNLTARDAAQLLTYASMVGLTIENTRFYSELEREVAQRTDELRAALERAQEADRLKGQFLASISHELRTPLNAIIGFSTVMLDELDGPITALQREDLKTINQNGRFLLHLINELLDLARIEAGKLELNLESVDLRALVGDIVDTVQGLVRNKDVMLRVSLPPKLPPIRGDADKIRQILLNLLSNAVKFTERGSITITAQGALFADDPADVAHTLIPDAIDAAEAPANGHNGPYIIREGRRFRPFIALSVRDTGIGITQKNQELIFEEFRQVHAGRTGKRGSGLGLAITRKLIEAHGGKIWVESTPGQGSTFTFT
ncbi:MAG TPA: cache domain-containing protein, partial [Roseiflexaceae bacterium]|nr:cache domain-containing protein [Roseiflexaceae bacterium]